MSNERTTPQPTIQLQPLALGDDIDTVVGLVCDVDDPDCEVADIAPTERHEGDTATVQPGGASEPAA